MMKLSVVLLVVVAVSVVAASDCDHWCKTPEGKNYCCGPHRPGIPYPSFEEHDGKCPDVLPICIGAARVGPDPTVCPHDGACARHQKCCFDRCLEHHACKAPH